MPIISTRCPVLGSHVTQVTDLEGRVIQIICAEYDETTGACTLSESAKQEGPLGQLLERVSEDTLNRRSTQCVFRAA